MTMPTKWNVSPGTAIGPIELGMSESDVERAAGPPLSTSERSIVRTLRYGVVTVILVSGSVTTIVAEYESEAEVVGLAPIRVGMPFSELRYEIGTDLLYDDEEGLWRVPGRDGLLLEVARPAEHWEQPIDPPFVPEQYEVTRPELALVHRIFVQ
jgi:hypothetical protein